MTLNLDKKIADQASDLHYSQLNAVRLFVVLTMAFGYASTMPQGPGMAEWGKHWGYDPSWFAIQVLFFLSGLMGYRSLMLGRTGWTYLKSRIRRTLPLLALYTASVVVLLYPILCAPEARTFAEVPKLGRYFLETVFLINPSQRLPGLMDNALYMCLAQGALWTLRWGLILHIGTAIGGALGIFKNKVVLLAMLVVATVTYGFAHFFSTVLNSAALDILQLPLRLGYIFLGGMTAYAWKDHLPKTAKAHTLILGSLAILTSIQFLVLPWTPLIEITATAFWCYLSFVGLQRNLPRLQNWPNLVLATFLGAWPIAQLFTLASPAMSIGAIILSTMVTSVMLAYVLHRFRGLIGPRGSHRKVAVQAT